jgi:hypothetical protein
LKKVAALMATAAMALTIGAISVAASDTGYHPNGNSCDAGHGAFGAFSHHDQFDNAGINWRSLDAREDGGLGHETGPAESAASAACRLAN